MGQTLMNGMKEHHRNDEEQFVKNNRQKKQTPKLGMGWCGGCDLTITSHTDGKKCPYCGYINGIKRLKKEK